MICSTMEVKQMSVEINRDPLWGNFKIRMQRFGPCRYRTLWKKATMKIKVENGENDEKAGAAKRVSRYVNLIL